MRSLRQKIEACQLYGSLERKFYLELSADDFRKDSKHAQAPITRVELRNRANQAKDEAKLLSVIIGGWENPDEMPFEKEN